MLFLYSAVLYLSFQHPFCSLIPFPHSSPHSSLTATLTPYLVAALLSSGTLVESRRYVNIQGKEEKESSICIRLLPAMTVCHISNASMCADEDSQEWAWGQRERHRIVSLTGQSGVQTIISP